MGADGAAPVNAVLHYLDLPAGEDPDRVAFRVGPRESWSYGDLLEAVGARAELLRAVGVKRGDRVAVALPDSPSAVAFLLAAMRMGAIAVPLSAGASACERAAAVADCEPAAIVVPAEQAIASVESRRRTGWPRVVLASREAGPSARCGDGDAGAEDPTVIDAETCLSATACGPVAAVGLDAPALIQYTSGSTGAPKGVVHLHRGLLALPRGFGRRLALAPGDLCFSTAKISFGYGLGNSVLFPLSAGAAAVLRGQPSDPAGVLETIVALRPTVFFSGPSLYRALLALPRGVEEDAFSSVRLCVSAGDVLPSSVFEAWRRRFGHEILDGLGSTECLHIFMAAHPGMLRAGRLGQAIPPYEVRLVDEHEREVAPGELGQLRVRGPANFSGYWRRARQTRDRLVEGWTRTGDLMIREDGGQYCHMGRSDDVFKVGEQKVAPAEVERLLETHPAVLECAVVGAADRHGHVVAHAFVRVLAGHPAGRALERDLRAHLRESLGAHKVPRRFRFVSELPRTATGKLARGELRKSLDGSGAPAQWSSPPAAARADGAR